VNTIDEEAETRPLDVEAMRASAGRLLGDNPQPLGLDELDRHLSILSGHIQLLIPEVEKAAGRRPKDDIPRYCALACVGEARMKLNIHQQPGAGLGVPYARKLGRVLNALLDHYETLGEQTMCLACDRPIRDGDDSMPYDKVSPSGGAARAGRIHTVCANTIRRG